LKADSLSEGLKAGYSSACQQLRPWNKSEYLLSQCQDPFNHDDVPESLVNIITGTGQVASEEVENLLWNIPKKGKTVADRFVKE